MCVCKFDELEKNIKECGMHGGIIGKFGGRFSCFFIVCLLFIKFLSHHTNYNM